MREGFSLQEDRTIVFGQDARRAIYQSNVEFINKVNETSKDTQRASEKNFTDIYPEQEINADMKLVSTLEKKFDQDLDHLTLDEQRRISETKERADALETTIVNLGELSNWFGENAKVFRTTKFDDIINGVDAVVEILPEDGEIDIEKLQHIALAIDASTTTQPELIKFKFIRNFQKIIKIHGHATEVKYYESPTVDDEENPIYKGSLTDIIPVIVGMEKESANTLMALYTEILKLQSIPKRTPEQKEELKKKNKQAKDHPAQVLFLRQIRIQLDAYQDIINRLTDFPRKKELIQMIKNLDKIILNIDLDKADIKAGNLDTDTFYRELKNICNNLPAEDAIAPNIRKPKF